jgi:hypothetical protein
MKVGEAYVGKDRQWYYYTEEDIRNMAKVKDMIEDLTQEAYEVGAMDAYYGRQPRLRYGYGQFEKEAYLNGYETQPYGEKDYGYDD